MARAEEIREIRREKAAALAEATAIKLPDEVTGGAMAEGDAPVEIPEETAAE